MKTVYLEKLKPDHSRRYLVKRKDQEMARRHGFVAGRFLLVATPEEEEAWTVRRAFGH